jgi:nucleoside-diphosphate-sugar epimerase
MAKRSRRAVTGERCAVNLFVFGLGYSALHFVRRYRDRFARIGGTVTSPEKAAALAAEGVACRVFAAPGAVDASIAADLAEADALVVSIPPSDTDPVLDAFGEALAASPRLAWIGYLSTIGVYGDHGGGWVDEATPPIPANPRSRQRLEAERAWLDLGRRTGKAVQIFRLAGIYGPGQNALANLAAGTARRVIKPGQVFNRIHVDDIAAVLAASIERPRAGAIYNVADDEPAPPQDVIAYAATLAGVDPPPEIPFAKAAMSATAASFWAESKRVRNRLIKDELQVRLAYPTYRDGLAALRKAGEGPPASPRPS